MITSVFLFLVLSTILCKVFFYQSVSKIYRLSTQQNVNVFDVNYHSAAQMRSDITFLKNLCIGTLIENVIDITLKTELNKARYLLRYQLFFGVFAVGLVLINSFILN